MAITGALKSNTLILMALICVGTLQVPTNFAYALNCSAFFLSLDNKTVLGNAYNFFPAE